MQCLSGFECGTAPDWVVAILAALAAAIAWYQLRAAANAARDQAEIARATLLLEIDKEFESEVMQESRRMMRALRNQIVRIAKHEVKSDNPTLVKPKADELFSLYMNRLWDDFRKADDNPGILNVDMLRQDHVNNPAKPDDEPKPSDRAGLLYQRLTKLLGWLETVGHMANERLLPQADIIKVYDFVFIEILDWFDGHIRYRRVDGVVPNLDWMAESDKFRKKILEERTRRAEKAAQRDQDSKGVSNF